MIHECKECGREDSIPYNCCPGCSAYGSYKELEQTSIEKLLRGKTTKRKLKLYCSSCRKEIRHGDNKDYHSNTTRMNNKISNCCDATICDGRNF